MSSMFRRSGRQLGRLDPVADAPFKEGTDQNVKQIGLLFDAWCKATKPSDQGVN